MNASTSSSEMIPSIRSMTEVNAAASSLPPSSPNSMSATVPSSSLVANTPSMTVTVSASTSFRSSGTI